VSRAAVLAREEQDAITRTLTVTPYVRMAGTEHRELALTFDDGPGPYTTAVLRVLTRTHTPATFFEVGAGDRYFARATAQVVSSGDPIGDHTEDHKAMSHLSSRAQRHQLLEEASKMGDAGVPFPDMFRPPYGLWNRTTLKLLRGYHMLMVLWSVDTDDWERPGVKGIVGAALQGAKPGAIILLHDGGGDRSQTVAALPRIIRALRRRGYRLVTVPRLLLDNPPPRQQDVASLKGAGG
jgi:peptidoglycan/xylan/chitin deacetylase (PgdA/CDA1 family)